MEMWTRRCRLLTLEVLALVIIGIVMIAAAGCDEPSTYSSLTEAENRIMGAFLKLSPEGRQTELIKLTDLAGAEVRKRRKELF